MRVAFVTQGPHVPAARFRVHQVVPALQAHVECSVFPASPSVYGDTERRLWRPLMKPLSVVSRVRQLDEIAAADVVWLQRPMTEYFWTGLERWVARRRPYVFDFDDAIFHNRWGLEARKLRWIIDHAAHVVAGNRYLAAFVGDSRKTTIIPTVVDAERYSARPEPDGPFTIVWTGMSHNQRELIPYRASLATVLAKTRGRFVVIADQLSPELAGLPVEFVRWSPKTEVTALAQGHVGIMPLANTPYNRGKCAFKLIQYMARGIAVVASPVGANVDVVRAGVDGLLANTPDEWTSALLEVAGDHDKRRQLGRSGRKRVESEFSVKAVVPRYLGVIQAAT
jgi:glycosyltransferase involved in cell wall biosynthesis